MADLIRRLSDCDFSLKSASRWRMASSAPPASPALIMLQYSRSNALGCLAQASERVWPLSMSSTMSPSEFLSTPGLHWPSRIFRLRRIGRPASWSVESCRVNVHNCLVEIRPMVNDFFFRRPPFLALPRVAVFFAFSAILVTKKPFCRMSCWASSCVAASIESLTSRPVWSIASY